MTAMALPSGPPAAPDVIGALGDIGSNDLVDHGRDGPGDSGGAPIGLKTMPGRATNAALQPTASAPDTSQEWAATSRTSAAVTPNASATAR